MRNDLRFALRPALRVSEVLLQIANLTGSFADIGLMYDFTGLLTL